MGPLIISQRLFGFTTRLGKLVEPGEETADSTAGIRVLMFDKVMEKYADKMVCKKGCDECCRFLNLFAVEAFALSYAFLNMNHANQKTITQACKTSKKSQICPLLIKNECVLYPQRPIICRTHGLPIYMEKDGQKQVDFCPKNFKGIKGFGKEALLSIEQLNTTLTAVNAHFLESIETDSPLPDRIPISEVFYLLG
ncbi:MAG: YkgJ family cysteine cluster protein [Desulfobacteraceae bacterium]|nr:YkgJ family cysteine cluster protein [Desulfobacteraceae bacterium]